MRSSYNTNQFMRGLHVQQSVIFALLMKEYKARLNGSRFGLFWTLVEPAAFVLILTVMWTAVGRTGIAGVPMALFIAGGMLPLKLFQACINSVPLGVRQNLNLLDYPNVKPIDAVYARFVLEVMIMGISGVLLFAGLAWFGNVVSGIKNFPTLIVVLVVYFFGCFGTALILSVYRTKSESLHRFIPLITTPIMFVSAVFYPLSILPLQAQYWLSWNPIVQVNELIRVNVFGITQQPDIDFNYLAKYAMITLFFGFIAYYANRFKLLLRR